MIHRDDQESLGLLLVWAVGRALRQVGVAGAVAVLSCAPFVAFAGVTLARGEYQRLRIQTEHAARAARHAELEVRALRRERAQEPDPPVTQGCAGLAPAPPSPHCLGDLAIETIARDRYAVPRESVDCMLQNSARLGPVRVLPEVQKGRVVGVRLFGVARIGTLWALGLRSGDVLVTVNDFDISSPDHALEAYSGARRSPVIRLGILRGGEPRELRYYITGW